MLRTDKGHEDFHTEKYADRKVRIREEKARLAAMNPLQRMTDDYIEKNPYDPRAIAANEAHRQYTIWQFQQFICGHTAGWPLPEISRQLGLPFGTMKNFRKWLDLPKRNRGRQHVDPFVRLDIKMPETMFAAVKRRARQRQCTANHYVRGLIAADLAGGDKPP